MRSSVELGRSTNSCVRQNPWDLVLESYTRIADGAEDLINQCNFDQSDDNYAWVFSGVQRFGGNWNVVVQKMAC